MVHKAVSRGRVAGVITASAAVALACALLLPLIGSAHVDYARAWAGVSPDSEILFRIRVPRVLMAMLAGGALAIAGLMLQALLRDALATPYTLGVSSGASLGAVAAISSGLHQLAGMPAIHAASFAGAFATLLVVLAAGSKGRRLSPFTLLLAGVTVNSMCMAMILFLHSVSTLGQSIAITRWLMGGIEAVDARTITWVSTIVLPLAVYAFARARQWNLIAIGEEWAEARGVETSRYLLAGYIVSSLLTGAVTALTGPVGFVGLIVPHALRLLLGADHRLLIPASLFAGAAFLAVCDTVARTILAPAEVPVGVITAILGGPFFIWILRTR
jgi:iron complex transport system permease protein